MINKHLDKWFIRGAVVASILALSGCSASTPEATGPTAPEGDAPKAAPAVAVPVTTQVMTHPSQGEVRTVEGAQSTLVKTEKGAMLSITTGDLTPGHVYTLWVIVINKPEVCASSPCTGKDFLGNSAGVASDVIYGDGVIAGQDGKITLTAWIPAGAWSGSWYGNGFTNALGAEIQATINDHGPVIAGREYEMLTSYRAACTDESLPPPFPDTAKADGAAGPNKCALMQFTIFSNK